MKKFLVFMFLVAFLLSGCGGVSFQRVEREQGIVAVVDSSDMPYGVSRFIDEEAGVVCWTVKSYHERGISCLPISETNLK